MISNMKCDNDNQKRLSADDDKIGLTKIFLDASRITSIELKFARAEKKKKKMMMKKT